MSQSLQKFNHEFHNELRDLHWRQWAALGVAAHIEPEQDIAVDIEALIVSTFAIYNLDLRLSEAMCEWVEQNREFIVAARLNRIAQVFSDRKLGKHIKLIDEKKIDLLKEIKNKQSIFHYLREATPEYINKDEFNDYWIGRKEVPQPRNIIAKPQYSSPTNLHVLLRSLLGTDARSDVMLYLLLNKEGNSYAIAKDISHDQKNVYRILEQWVEAGIAGKIEEPKKNRYMLNKKKEWMQLFGYKKPPVYVNWICTFLLYDTISKALRNKPWSDDEYLMHSLLNDLENEIKSVEVMGGEVGQIRKMQDCVYDFGVRKLFDELKDE